MQLAKIFPIIEWLGNYKKEWFKGDLSAGLTVGVMLIPQGMAYAMIAGLEPVYGLYAATIPLVIYAIFGTSRQLAVGPVAMVSMLTAAAIAPMADGNVTMYLSLAIIMALMVGMIQFLMGVFKLGFIVNFLSHPVISGFTSAAALIIGLSQLKHILGISIDRTHHIHKILYNAFEQFGQFNWVSIGIGVAGIVLILVVKKINKALPSQLFAVILGIAMIYFFNLDEMGVKILKDVPSSLPSFELPNFSYFLSGEETSTFLGIQIPAIKFEMIQKLGLLAIAISMVSFMESFAVAKAIQSKHKDYKIDANQELVALGVTNIVSSFFQSFPTTGGFSRTAVNDQAGARSGLAAVISAILVVLAILFLTGLFYFLPKAILGAIIMVAVVGLIDYKEAFHLWKSDRADFYLLMATFVSTLSFGIMEGIMIGVVLSLGTIIYRTTRPHIAILGRMPNTHIYKNVKRFDKAEIRKDVLILRPDARLYFANIAYLKAKIDYYVNKKGDALKLVIINADSINSIDSSAATMLKDVYEELANENIFFVFSGIKGPVRDIFKTSGLTAKIGEDRFFTTVKRALDCYDEEGCKMIDGFSRQTNN